MRRASHGHVTRHGLNRKGWSREELLGYWTGVNCEWTVVDGDKELKGARPVDRAYKWSFRPVGQPHSELLFPDEVNRGTDDSISHSGSEGGTESVWSRWPEAFS